MNLFKGDIHRDVWLEMNCARCFQVDEVARRLRGKDTRCPIQKRALRVGRKTLPPEWERTRSSDMADTYRCNEFMARPDSVLRKTVQDGTFEQFVLFDVDSEKRIEVVDHA